MKSLNFMTPRKGQLVKVAEDLYWARFELPFRLNHINVYFLESDNGWIIIDCGINDENTREHWEQLFLGPLKNINIDKIIITHHHPDHIGFSSELEKMSNASFFISKSEKENAEWLMKTNETELLSIIIKAYESYNLNKKDINTLKKRGSKYKQRVKKLPYLKIIEEGEKIRSKYGEWEVRLDEGHSPEHISLIDKTRKLYISADFLLPRISPNISADLRDINSDRAGSYLNYLLEFSNLEDDFKIFPGHDWPFTKGGSRAKELIMHHNKRLEKLLIAAEVNTLTVNSSIDILFGRKFDEHELFFASGEARAHLNHLVKTKKLRLFKNDQNVDFFNLFK